MASETVWNADFSTKPDDRPKHFRRQNPVFWWRTHYGVFAIANDGAVSTAWEFSAGGAPC